MEGWYKPKKGSHGWNGGMVNLQIYTYMPTYSTYLPAKLLSSQEWEVIISDNPLNS